MTEEGDEDRLLKILADADRRHMWVDEGQRDTIKKLANMVAERDKEIERLNQLLHGTATTPP